MPVRRHIRRMEGNVRTLAELDVGSMWSSMLGEFLGEWERLHRQGVAGDSLERELLSFVEGLSEKPVAELARTSSTVAYAEGRSAAILSAAEAGEVEYVVRSEVLDENTCGACQILDGLVVEVGSDEYYENLPPAKCEGRDRCRGFYIPVASEGA